MQELSSFVHLSVFKKFRIRFEHSIIAWLTQSKISFRAYFLILRPSPYICMHVCTCIYSVALFPFQEVDGELDG